MPASTSRSRIVLTIAVASLTLLGAMVAPGRSLTNDIPHPDEYFGREVGSAGVLVRHADILDYYRLLAERSDRVQLVHMGDTTDGRPFYYALVSSPANLARLDALLADNGRLYDPRDLSAEEAERIIANGVAFVVLNGQIHSTEVGASQGGILLAWRLAAGDDEEVRRILENVVIAHVPVHNPDGQEMVIDWLDRQRGTRYQNSPPPFLYHRYTGHDNNRDWYMFTQQETRQSVAMQNRFHPQMTVDQHQQGSTGARIFVPPFEDPWEPNVDSALIASNNMIGTFMGQYLTARGYAGVEWKAGYDAWTPARAYYHTHGGVRVLTEVAGSDYADDLEIPFERLDAEHRQRRWSFPMPWPGGTWRFADVVEYHYAAAMAALRAAADLRPHLLRGMWAAQVRSVSPPDGSPTAFVFPAEQPDPPVAAKLLEVLRIADVELFEASEAFRVADVEVPAGSVVVPFAQPAGRFARSVLERQEYPRLFLYEGGPLDPPYDVAAHTLPLLMNVEVLELRDTWTAQLRPVEDVNPPPGGIVEAGVTSAAYLLDPSVNNSYVVASHLGGTGVMRATEKFEAAGRSWPAGTFLVIPEPGVAGVADRQTLAELSARLHVQAVGVRAIPEVQAAWIGAPRVGVYQSYAAAMPEGWLRYVLDTHEFPYDILRDADVRAGDLAPYDVIFLPPGSERSIVQGLAGEARQVAGRRLPPSPPAFSGGLGEEGVAALRRFVEGGGTLFTWASSTEVVTRHLGGPPDVGAAESRTRLNIPGSVLRAAFDTEHWLAYGLDAVTPVFFWNSPFWETESPGGRVVARYPEDDLLLSGWLQGEELVAGRSALVEVPLGRGRAVMVGFSPEYRAQAHRTYKILFNAILRPRPGS